MTLTHADQRDSFQRRCRQGLLILLILFAFRVAAQLLQKLAPVHFLPAFDSWQSGTLPYGVLLALQMLLLVVMVRVQLRMRSGKLLPRPGLGVALLSFGSVYFALMLFRLGAAYTFGVGQPFLGAALPAFFHVVLSSWMLLLGLFHYFEAPSSSVGGIAEKPWEQAVSWLAYPLLMTGGLWLHFVLLSRDVSLLLSTYIPVAAGAALITWMERRFPHRREWRPDAEDVKSDLTFMVLVQILLPKALAFLLAVTAVRWLQSHELSLAGLWPQGMAPVAQAGLMLLLADFLRYWLHRASHEWSTRLWSLHAVHHSPQKLYWFNVGRFHPVEKAVQFLCDAAPFILLGVTEDVLAIYFVFYAVNGFIQHCNIRLRLGWLNYVISGPELHRWHHSWEIRESNKNYGNNIILWDLLFGSFFQPQDREVGMLGLKNRHYPRDFFSQMKTPFINGLDKHEP
ncbi:MAG: sterol desaturase family protein [Verrucomicrobiales bacterium]